MCGSSSEETQGNIVEATTEVTEEALVEESEVEVDVETSETQFNFEIVLDEKVTPRQITGNCL
jgi:hypothetical protein|tara:strand:- start:907 stop:1095 length:189 start_codon:yes stop_codon:yes gene_type:complete